MIIHAKMLNAPQSLPEMEAIVAQWQELKIPEVYILSQQIALPHVAEALKAYTGKIWIVLQTLFDTEDGAFPLAITDAGEKAIAQGKGSWLKMLCPRGLNSSGKTILSYRTEQLKKLISTYHPSGISLDFIRNFVFWEEIYPETSVSEIPRSCFCSTCCGAFEKHFRLSIPRIHKNRPAQWILANHKNEWNTFSQDTITHFVETLTAELKKMYPALQFNLHTVPWSQNEFQGARLTHVGQNIKAMKSNLNRISPMAYTPMLQRPLSWIHTLTKSLANESELPVFPAIQICPMYGTHPLSDSEFKEMLHHAVKPPSAGVVIWPWETVTEEQFKTLKKATETSSRHLT